MAKIHLEVPAGFTPDKYAVHQCSCGSTVFTLLREKTPPHEIACFICQGCGTVFTRDTKYGKPKAS